MIMIGQTSDNEPHPGAIEGAVPHVTGAVDALFISFYIVHRQHSCVIDHVGPVSHVQVISCRKKDVKI